MTVLELFDSSAKYSVWPLNSIPASLITDLLIGPVRIPLERFSKLFLVAFFKSDSTYSALSGLSFPGITLYGVFTGNIDNSPELFVGFSVKVRGKFRILARFIKTSGSQ